MNKELFVSTTPHETRVGLVEDDLLAEIYLERENEYTLAGSIYKGRVTRVLPGMQSAFVDIGLERDAFLYVSDFMELEDTDDVDEIPASATQQRSPRPPQQRVEAQPVVKKERHRWCVAWDQPSELQPAFSVKPRDSSEVLVRGQHNKPVLPSDSGDQQVELGQHLPCRA